MADIQVEVQAVIDDATRAALAKATEAIERMRSASIDDLRRDGWTVAIHNDYRQDGQPRTFWLLTHPDGCYVKGEGETDAEAIAQLRQSIAALQTHDYYSVVYRIRGATEPTREIAFSAEHARQVREARATSHAVPVQIERSRSFTGPWREVEP